MKYRTKFIFAMGLRQSISACVITFVDFHISHNHSVKEQVSLHSEHHSQITSVDISLAHPLSTSQTSQMEKITTILSCMDTSPHIFFSFFFFFWWIIHFCVYVDANAASFCCNQFSLNIKIKQGSLIFLLNVNVIFWGHSDKCVQCFLHLWIRQLRKTVFLRSRMRSWGDLCRTRWNVKAVAYGSSGGQGLKHQGLSVGLQPELPAG